MNEKVLSVGAVNVELRRVRRNVVRGPRCYSDAMTSSGMSKFA